MKQRFEGRLLLLLASFLFFSCQKNETLMEKNTPKSQIEAKVTAWIEERIAKANTPEKQAKIEALKNNLELSKVWTEDFADGETFVLVPVKEGLPSAHNRGKQKSSTLMLTVNKQGTIRKGTVVQYVAASGSTATPHGSFHAMYNFKKMKQDGSFTILNLLDKRLEEYTYKNGELSSWGSIDRKPTAAAGGSRPAAGQRTAEQVCTDWYWVTTWSDGSQTWEFMYQTCRDTDGNGCRPDEECDVVGGGGGGYVDIDTEDFAARQKTWDVAENPSGAWIVKSTEEFAGRRDSTGRRFTYTEHVQDKLFPVNQTYVFWTRTEMNNWGEGTATAHASIKGVIETDNGTLNNIAAAKSFPYSQVFN